MMYCNSYCIVEDDDDDWFYNSIQRYDDLLMFAFQGRVSSAAFLSAGRLIATCQNTSGRHEILELAVPDRLLAGKDAGIVKNRDFSVEAAGYLKSEPSCVIPNDNIVITAEDEGVQVYNIPNHSDTDLITHNRLIRNLTNSKIYFDAGKKEILSGSKLDNIKSHSIETGEEKQDFSNIHPAESLKGNHCISFLESRNNALYIGCSDTGLLYNIDNRSNIVQSVCLDKKYKWAYSLSLDDKIGLVNSAGIIYVFDQRNFVKEILKIDSQFEILENNSSLKIQFDPHNSYVSVSGFDKCVKIFSLESSIDGAHRFAHDGHKNCSCITGHIWHSSLINVIFSYDDTGSLQAWKFR